MRIVSHGAAVPIPLLNPTFQMSLPMALQHFCTLTGRLCNQNAQTATPGLVGHHLHHPPAANLLCHGGNHVRPDSGHQVAERLALQGPDAERTGHTSGARPFLSQGVRINSEMLQNTEPHSLKLCLNGARTSSVEDANLSEIIEGVWSLASVGSGQGHS